MRTQLIVATMGAALSCTPAAAASILQTVNGTSRGATFLLFDPSVGTLDLVQIAGTMGISAGLVRDQTFTYPAVSIPRSTTLQLGSGSPFFSGTVSGAETYDTGSMFGVIDLSGGVFVLLTGGAASSFVDQNQGPGIIVPLAQVQPQVVASSSARGLRWRRTR